MSTSEASIKRETSERAFRLLKQALREEAGFVKVHAAEALLDLGASDDVHAIFLRVQDEHGHTPGYRIGIWRVLTRSGSSDDVRQRWTSAIRDVALDVAAPDRIGAMESLAKLRYRIPRCDHDLFEDAAASSTSGLAIFTQWALVASGESDRQTLVTPYLQSEDLVARLRAGFVLRHFPSLSNESRQALKGTAQNEPPDTNAYAYLTGSSFLVGKRYGDEVETTRCYSELVRIAGSREASEKQAACGPFAEQGGAADLEWLELLMSDASVGVVVAAALAYLRIQNAYNRRL